MTAIRRSCDFITHAPVEGAAIRARASKGGLNFWSTSNRFLLVYLGKQFRGAVASRSYFYLNGLVDSVRDWIPLFAIPQMASRYLPRCQGSMSFRQARIEPASKRITVYRFRTMPPVAIEEERRSAITTHQDDRVTCTGRTLRHFRLAAADLQQTQKAMSWIKPRTQAPCYRGPVRSTTSAADDKDHAHKLRGTLGLPTGTCPCETRLLVEWYPTTRTQPLELGTADAAGTSPGSGVASRTLATTMVPGQRADCGNDLIH